MKDGNVLAYDPWASDESDCLTLRDKMLITRTVHTCAICFEAIPVGALIRAQTQLNREIQRVMTFRFCPACCRAMSIAWKDDRPICARTAIGMRAAGAL